MNSFSQIHLSRPVSVLGSRVVATDELCARIPDFTAVEAVKRTGVEKRRWCREGEDVVSLALSAANRLIDRLGNREVSMITCSTSTPRDCTPSIACQVATKIAERVTFTPGFYAFDFNAACSGYLYGLRLACDHLRANPEGAVLLLTSEKISPMMDLTDPVTCFLFGDGATATMVVASPSPDYPLAATRPHCAAVADPTRAIWAPSACGAGYLTMDGTTIARAAYKAMASALHEACRQSGIGVSQLAALVPHPGSQRVMEMVARALEMESSKVFSTLRDTGNISSSSIPLVLDRYWDALPMDTPIGLTAFGAGFTAAAAIAQVEGVRP